jgi:tetratricopeptide (TPR) repeat protein
VKRPSSGKKSRKPGREDATTEDAKALGAAIARLRLLKGLRPVELSRRARIKPYHLAAYEQGRRIPRPETLERITRVLDSSVEEVQALTELLAAATNLGKMAAAARALRQSATLARAAEALLEPIRSRQPQPPIEQDAQALLEWLRPYSTAQRRALILEDEAFHSRDLSLLLCQESLDTAADDADAAAALAGLAELAATLSRDRQASLSRLQGFTVFHLGNAARVKGELPWAAEQFRRAEALWKQGAGGDPEGRLNEARVLGLQASLCGAQRDLPAALVLLDRALSIGGSETKYLLLNRGKVLEEMGRHEEAVEDLRRAASCIDPDREPALLLSQRANLLVNLVHLGRYQEAEAALPEVRDLAERVGKKLNTLRVRWLEGLTAAGLERIEEAIATLEEVRREFAARGIAFDTALVSLDLAVIYLKQGRTAEVKELAAEMVAIFRAQRVQQEALAAVLVFQKAADRERATIEQARRLAGYLRQAQHDPGLKPGG